MKETKKEERRRSCKTCGYHKNWDNYTGDCESPDYEKCLAGKPNVGWISKEERRILEKGW